MLVVRVFCRVMLLAGPASLAQAQAPAAQQQKPSVQEVLQRIDALQRRAADGNKVIDSLRRRVDRLKSRDQHPKRLATTARHEPAAGQKKPLVLVGATKQVRSTIIPPRHVVPQAMPVLRPPEPMGSQYAGEGQDALRSDFPGLSIRIPARQSEVRF